MAVETKKAITTQPISAGGKKIYDNDEDDDDPVTTISSSPKKDSKKKDKRGESASSLDLPKKRKQKKSSTDTPSSRSLNAVNGDAVGDVVGAVGDAPVGSDPSLQDKPIRKKTKSKDAMQTFPDHRGVGEGSKKKHKKMTAAADPPGDVSSQKESVTSTTTSVSQTLPDEKPKPKLKLKSDTKKKTEKSLLEAKLLEDETKKSPTRKTGSASAAGDFASKKSVPIIAGSSSNNSSSPMRRKSKTPSFITSSPKDMDGWTIISPRTSVTKQKIRKIIPSLLNDETQPPKSVETKETPFLVSHSSADERSMPPTKTSDNSSTAAARKTKPSSLTTIEQKKRLESINVEQQQQQQQQQQQPVTSKKQQQQQRKARDKQTSSSSSSDNTKGNDKEQRLPTPTPSSASTEAPLEHASLEDNAEKSTQTTTPLIEREAKPGKEINASKKKRQPSASKKQHKKVRERQPSTTPDDTDDSDVDPSVTTGHSTPVVVESTEAPLEHASLGDKAAKSSQITTPLIEMQPKPEKEINASKKKRQPSASKKQQRKVRERQPSTITPDSTDDSDVDSPTTSYSTTAAESTEAPLEHASLEDNAEKSIQTTTPLIEMQNPDKEINASKELRQPVTSKKQQRKVRESQPSSNPDSTDDIDVEHPPSVGLAKPAAESTGAPPGIDFLEENSAKSSQSTQMMETKTDKEINAPKENRQSESPGADIIVNGRPEIDDTIQPQSQSYAITTEELSGDPFEDVPGKAQTTALTLLSTKIGDSAALKAKPALAVSEFQKPTGNTKVEQAGTLKKHHLDARETYPSSTLDLISTAMAPSTTRHTGIDHPPTMGHSKSAPGLTETTPEGMSATISKTHPPIEMPLELEINQQTESVKEYQPNESTTSNQEQIDKFRSSVGDECRADQGANVSDSHEAFFPILLASSKASDNVMKGLTIPQGQRGDGSDDNDENLKADDSNDAEKDVDRIVSSSVQRRIESRKAKRATVAEEVATVLSRIEGKDKSKAEEKKNNSFTAPVVDESKGNTDGVACAVPANSSIKMKSDSGRPKTRGGRRNKPEDKKVERELKTTSSQPTLESSGASRDMVGSKRRIFEQAGSDIPDWAKASGSSSSRSDTPSPKSRKSMFTPTNSPRLREFSTRQSFSPSIVSSSTGKPEGLTPPKRKSDSGPSPALKQKIATFSSCTSAPPSPGLFGLLNLGSKSLRDMSSLSGRTSTLEPKQEPTELTTFDLPFSSSSNHEPSLPNDSPVKGGESQYALSKSALIEALTSPGRKLKEALAEVTSTPRVLKRGFVDLNVKSTKSTTKTPGQRVMDSSHHGRDKARTYVDSALEMLSDEGKSAEVERLVSKIESLGGFPKTRRLSMRDNELVGTLVMAVRNDPRITQVHVDAGMFGSISSTLLSQFIDSLRVNLHVKSLAFHGLELGNAFLYDLAASMESNFVLEEIDLSSNLFTNEGLANFCQALALNNDSVKRLNLKNQTTPISEASQVDVLDAFQQNKTLIKVELDFISDDGREKLEKILERNRLLGSTQAKNVDEKLISVLSDEVERAQELWEQQQEELHITDEEDNDYDYLHELAVLFDRHKLKKEVEENVKEFTGPPKRTNADDLSADEKTRFLFGEFKKNMEESVMAFKEDGSFLTPEFIAKYFKERPEEDALDFDFHGQWKLFKRFPIHDPARQVIVDKFVDALAMHPRANELTGINMANTGAGDDFLQALSKRCLGDTLLLPNLHTLNFETNFINEPGVVALANMIASPDACRYLQVIRLENQKGLLKSKAEFALAKAMRVNRSIVVLSLTIRNLLERERLGKYILRNVDLLRQARQEHMKATGTQRERNKVEQIFDRVRGNDADLAIVNMMGNERFLTLTQEEKSKAACSFAHNMFVKEIHFNGCGIDDAFAYALSESFITNTTLEKVYLEGNCISGEGIKALFVGLGKNSSIKELRLHKQTKLLATADEETLADFLDDNSTVTKIGIDLRSKVAQVKLDRKMGYNINLELKDKAAAK